jgi:2',3'-cyclic-nucleotide 2'-phosphodiesterase (5'-nucleotidase family)
MVKKTFYIATLFLFSVIGLTHSSNNGRETSITLIYTANTLGEVEPCQTCPEGADSGGLPRRSHFIKTIREEVKNLLIIDAGDALSLSYFTQSSEREKAKRRAEFVLRLYEILGYHVLNIGDTDLGLGIAFLKALQKKSKIPFLSANLKEKNTGKPVFEPYLVKEEAGVTIGIIGLVTTEISPLIQKELKGYFIENPIRAARETINRFMPSCDYFIALAHLSLLEIESLAKGDPRISIIIGGNDHSLIFPKQVHRSIYVQTDAFGAHIGRMNLRLVTGSNDYIDILPQTKIRKNIQEVQEKMKTPQYAKETEKLKEIEKQFLQQLSKMPKTEGKNTFENHLILMHPGMRSDKEIEKLIDLYRDQLQRPSTWR